MTGQTDDPDTIAAAMRGSRKAFERLVRNHQSAVRALSRRLAGNSSDGDDIAQSAFLTAWRRRATWRGGSFKAWVCAIAYREFLQARKAGQGGYKEAPESDVGVSPALGEQLDLLRAFADLEPNQRAAVALCLGAGMSHAEVAFAMAAPLGSVKSWVNRGRANLQRSLAVYEKV